MSATKNFWDKMAESYSKRPISDQAAYEKKLEISRTYFRPDMELLEFGCGTGGTALLQAPHVKRIQAIDSSFNMIAIARDKQGEAGVENVEFSVSDIEKFVAPGESFDAILGLSILHLLEDKEAVMKKVYGLLKPGGIFISSTVCLNDSMKYLKLAVPILRLVGYMPPVLEFFTTKELEQSLKDCGFVIDYQWRPKKGKATFIVAKKEA